MKIFFGLLAFAFVLPVFAEDSSTAWESSTISEATIGKVQATKKEYHKCVSEQMQKPNYTDMDSRKATEEIMKSCESVLGKMREIYTNDKVPGEIADRHLRQIRIQTTRNALQGMIFQQAAKQSGNP